MINSINFPVNEPYYCHGFLGSGNLLLFRMIHPGFPVPISSRFKHEVLEECAARALVGESSNHKTSPSTDQKLLGSMEHISTVIANTRHLF